MQPEELVVVYNVGKLSLQLGLYSRLHKSRWVSKSLQVFEKRFLLLFAQVRAKLVTASAVS